MSVLPYLSWILSPSSLPLLLSSLLQYMMVILWILGQSSGMTAHSLNLAISLYAEMLKFDIVLSLNKNWNDE